MQCRNTQQLPLFLLQQVSFHEFILLIKFIKLLQNTFSRGVSLLLHEGINIILQQFDEGCCRRTQPLLETYDKDCSGYSSYTSTSIFSNRISFRLPRCTTASAAGVSHFCKPRVYFWEGRGTGSQLATGSLAYCTDIFRLLLARGLLSLGQCHNLRPNFSVEQKSP